MFPLKPAPRRVRLGGVLCLSAIGTLAVPIRLAVAIYDMSGGSGNRVACSANHDGIEIRAERVTKGLWLLESFLGLGMNDLYRSSSKGDYRTCLKTLEVNGTGWGGGNIAQHNVRTRGDR